MRNEFTAIIERDGDWFIAYCPEIPGANGQGKTKDEARKSLADAISLILEDRREDALRGIPADAERGTVIVERSTARCSGTCASMAATSNAKAPPTLSGATQPRVQSKQFRATKKSPIGWQQRSVAACRYLKSAPSLTEQLQPTRPGRRTADRRRGASHDS